jgi:hypothetical protein
MVLWTTPGPFEGIGISVCETVLITMTLELYADMLKYAVAWRMALRSAEIPPGGGARCHLWFKAKELDGGKLIRCLNCRAPDSATHMASS